MTADIALDLGTMKGDATMLREAIANLADNAVQHGGPNLSTVTIRALRENRSLRLSVSDDGQGLDPRATDLALRRFTQTSETSGSGLGLPIAEAIATAHQGRLKIIPAPKGFRVDLIFPSPDTLQIPVN